MNVAAITLENLSRRGVSEKVSTALQEHYADKNSAVKRVAVAANANDRTAKKWWQGDNAPGVPEFLRLAAEVPALREWVAELLRIGPERRDPRAAKIADYIDKVLATEAPQ